MSVFFALSGSGRTEAAHRKLMKLTPAEMLDNCLFLTTVVFAFL